MGDGIAPFLIAAACFFPVTVGAASKATSSHSLPVSCQRNVACAFAGGGGGGGGQGSMPQPISKSIRSVEIQNDFLSVAIARSCFEVT